MTDLRPFALELLLVGCAMGLAGCAVATVMGTAWDVGRTVVKIPFILGKGVYDVLHEEPASRREPAFAPPRADLSAAQAADPVAIPFPVSPPDLPEERN